MRESFGSVFLYNIIILFLFITFAFLSGTLSYTKAFKANSFIATAIEKFEGYNDLSREEVLTDIQGIEDFFGDMDFKVAGTVEGITSIQVDTKLKGLSNECIRNSIDKAKSARLHILEKINGEKFFLDALKINTKFKFNMMGKNLIISLNINNLDKHFIYYLIDLLFVIENSIS